MKRIFTLTLVLIVATCFSFSPVSRTVSYGQSASFARVAAWNQQGVRFDNQGQVLPIHKPDELRAAIAAIDPDDVARHPIEVR